MRLHEFIVETNTLQLKYDELYRRYYKNAYRAAEKQGLVGPAAMAWAKDKLDQYKEKVRRGEIDPISKTKWWKDQQRIAASERDFWQNFNFGKQRDIEESVEVITEVAFDGRTGIGAVPDNANVDYRGLRVLVTPKTYLALSKPMDMDNEDDKTIEWLTQQLQQGQAFGQPFLEIVIPDQWEDNDLSAPARIAGHDGRHRMAAILAVEGNDPVEVHLFPRYFRNRHITPEWIASFNKHIISERQKLISGPWFQLA